MLASQVVGLSLRSRNKQGEFYKLEDTGPLSAPCRLCPGESEILSLEDLLALSSLARAYRHQLLRIPLFVLFLHKTDRNIIYLIP